MAVIRPLRLGTHRIDIAFTGPNARTFAPIEVTVVPRGSA